MSDDKPPFVDGTITAGNMRLFRVRVQDDTANTGGYVIATWNIANQGEGSDNWGESYDNLQSFFDDAGWAVEWDEPLEKLIRPPA